MNAIPNPDDYRHLEDFVIFAFECERFAVERTGQEYRPDLGRWSPDLHVTGSRSCWIDVKLRNREYAHFLIEDAEIQTHCDRFPPTAYVLVADDPLEIAGWSPATVCRQRGGSVRTDHERPGSGDPYRLVPAAYLRNWKDLIRWLR